MDETRLRTLLDQAVSGEPPAERPLGRIAADSRRLGGRLRRRRRAESATATVASVAVVALAVSLASGALGHTHNQGPAGHSGRSRGMAYVLTTLGRHYGYGAVVPVNLATMKAGKPLQSTLKGIMTYSNDIVAASGGRTLYVSTRRGVILPISTKTGKAGRAIRVPGICCQADQLLGANGKIAYAVGNGKITPIDLVTGSALRPISVPANSGAFGNVAVSRNGKTLLTAGVTAVTVVTSGRAHKSINLRVPPTNICVAVSPDGAMGYAFRRSLKGRYSVVPIDVATNKALSPINLPKQNYGVRVGPCSIALAPNGQTAYVLIGRYVAPIDLVTRRALKPIKLPADAADFSSLFGVDPDSRRAYAVADRVFPVNLVTHKSLRTIGLGNNGAFCLAFSPNGSTVLVGIGGTHTGQLLLIREATGKIVKSIRISIGVPASIAVTP